MFQLLLYYFKIIQYQVFYYFMGVFAVFDDLQNRSFNKFDIVNKRGKVAVVTGGARGIGLEVVRKLIECEMHVIIGCRDVKAGQRAIQQHISTDASIEIYALDLKSFTSVKHFTQQILTKHDQIHLLINNAGVMAVPFEKCEDGFEAHWTVNYLSHFLLTELLLPVLKMSGLEDEKARIVNVSSCAHELSPIINFEMINNSQGYIRNAAYAKSKLAQIMLTKYYNKKLSNTNVRVLAVHPGVVNTELFKDTFLKMTAPWILRFICKTPEEGARSIAYASVSPRLEGCGGYYGNCQPLKNLPYADDEETQKKLYDTSMAMVKHFLK
ncbi:dehydrogenase/reductase SDR family member on chromosome X-like isoform X2 [Sipha flava]|uniref:Dehydrogenase/reductase SDR family member on chromosome X-like isoform X2 n=3 Tax=Sipha flava TaxID=143950 RepID=A0A8B8FAI8_9HEMI|nr:dehydrogenase/reductase SDR family member on chromosome X-like isoform X2 [Sipha flava]